MALIKCPECGKEISDKANSCPNCGCPSSEFNKPQTDIDREIILSGSNDKNTELICEIIKKYSNPRNEIAKIIVQIRSFLDVDLITAKALAEKCIDLTENKKELPKTISANVTEKSKHEFSGVYRKSLFGKLQEVYCPRCGSENCSHYREEKIIPGKTKTRYTANLNPLKPFTLVNKKEKVVKKEQVIKESKFICNSCGKIFY